jgi:hypothetical protein
MEMETDMAKFSFGMALISVLIVVVVFGSLIGIVYASYVMPPFYAGTGYRTNLPWIAGLTIAALIGGYIGNLVTNGGQFEARIRASVVFAAMVAFSVLCISMLIVLNIRGT